MKKIIAVALALLIALTLISFAGCHTHDLVNVKAVEPSCTEEGNIEYYECSICGETFLDAEGRQKVSKDDVRLIIRILAPCAARKRRNRIMRRK